MPLDVQEIRQAYVDLANEFDSVLLGTVSEDGFPDASYAPYMQHDGHYYVYVSELASHTGNMLATNKASMLFIENEADAQSLFARRRVTYQAKVVEVERGSDAFELTMDAMADKFGKMMNMLRNLEDFRLLQLKPVQGRFVAGFGKAYNLTGEQVDVVEHINDRGHGKSHAKGRGQGHSQAK